MKIVDRQAQRHYATIEWYRLLIAGLTMFWITALFLFYHIGKVQAKPVAIQLYTDCRLLAVQHNQAGNVVSDQLICKEGKLTIVWKARLPEWQ